MINAIRNLLKWARISLSGDDSQSFPTAQMTYLSKTANVLMIYPYGMGANAPEDSLGIMLSSSSQEVNRAAIVTVNPNIRPKNLKKGEVYFGNPVAKNLIVAQADGTFAIFFNSQLKYIVSESEVKSISDFNLTANSNMKLQSSDSMNLESSNALNTKSSEVNLETTGVVNIKSNTVRLGESGQPIARVGDSVQVIITTGDSAGTWNGTITSGSTHNTSS